MYTWERRIRQDTATPTVSRSEQYSKVDQPEITQLYIALAWGHRSITVQLASSLAVSLLYYWAINLARAQELAIQSARKAQTRHGDSWSHRYTYSTSEQDTETLEATGTLTARQNSIQQVTQAWNHMWHSSRLPHGTCVTLVLFLMHGSMWHKTSMVWCSALCVSIPIMKKEEWAKFTFHIGAGFWPSVQLWTELLSHSNTYIAGIITSRVQTFAEWPLEVFAE